MDSPAVSAPTTSHRSTFACVRCSERKVKCNKQYPCNSCVRHHVQCVFRPPKPPSRRKREVVKNELVEERLKRYESLLREKGIDPNQVASTSETEHRLNSDPQPNYGQLESLVADGKMSILKPELIRGQRGTKLVDNSLWLRVAEEVRDEASMEVDSDEDTSDVEMSNDAYILGGNTPASGSPHPPAELIHQLWSTFLENVNPLTKLIHVPSLQPAMEKAIANIDRIPRGFEALMFAIYSIAVLSLTEDECNEVLGESRTTLLSRYVASTKVALSRAKFMNSTSIVVLQALILHIFSIRDDYEPRAVWTLTGVAVRIGEGMGMRLDGTTLGMSPFETEIRRRIWWQLKMHDFRAAELCGQPKFHGWTHQENSAKMPGNINDCDLYPAMLHPAVESERPTEMIWCMSRFELSNFGAAQKTRLHKLGKENDEYAVIDHLRNSIPLSFIKDLEDLFETKYLRFCDPSQPLQLMVLLVSRVQTNLVRFMSQHPRRWAKLEYVPASEQQVVWDLVLTLLGQYNMMQSTPQLRKFSWIVPYFIQWHIVIHALDTLRAHPLHTDAVKTWDLIKTLFENNAEKLLRSKKPMFVAVGSLCLKAFNARTAALATEGRKIPDPPEYITRLREERDAAKARRKAALTRCTTRDTFYSDTRMATENPTSMVSGPVEAAHITQLQQPGIIAQGNIRTGDDAFWLGDALENRAASDMMNFDMDASLAQDYWLDTAGGEVLDWTQWDSWLGGADPVRSNLGT